MPLVITRGCESFEDPVAVVLLLLAVVVLLVVVSVVEVAALELNGGDSSFMSGAALHCPYKKLVQNGARPLVLELPEAQHENRGAVSEQCTRHLFETHLCSVYY
mgnify:CR=1 FL=1